MSEANRVFIRSYCGVGCDCPTCHCGESEVENCVYCQLKWAGKGEYSLKYRAKQEWAEPTELKVCAECGAMYMIARNAHTGEEHIERFSPNLTPLLGEKDEEDRFPRIS